MRSRLYTALCLVLLLIPSLARAQNRAPHSAPGGPYTAVLDGADVIVRVDGSASTDDVAVAKYHWQVTGPDGALVADLTTPNALAALLFQRPGTYTLKLIAIDANSASSSASTTVDIMLAPVDCAVSDWSAWSEWVPVSLTEEQRSRTRTVTTSPANGGLPCPAMSETESRPRILPLQIACPAPVTAVATSTSGIRVTWPLATVTGGVSPTITYSRINGDVYPVGITTVTATASSTDGQSATCSFTVTVSGPAPAPTPTPTPTASTCQATSTGHPYFDQLNASPSCWRANPLRSQAAIDSVSSVKPNRWVTYDTSQDAARAVIPAFVPFLTIASVAPDRITFSRALTTTEKNSFAKTRAFRLDDEIVTVIAWTTFGQQFTDGDTSVFVNRAQFGTVVADHVAGTIAQISQNNLLGQVRVPLGTADGNTYLFTWDARWDSSYLGTDLVALPTSHKEFQLTAGKNTIWLETQTRADAADGIGSVAGFDRTKYVGLISARYYADTAAGSTYKDLTSTGTVKPQAGRFFIRANVWTRFWWVVEQRAGDYDLCTLWVADETTAPVKVFDTLALNARFDGAGVPTIAMWWLEQNTSYDLYRGATRDLVSWVRNFVALRNPGDVTPLLVQPRAVAGQ